MTRAIGIILGLLIAFTIISSAGGRSGARTHFPPGPIVSECDGALAEIVIQYVTGTDAVLPVYRDFLRQLDAGVTVHAMCPDRASFDELIERVGPTSCTIEPVITNHDMTSWSRDRWVALAGDRKIELLAPKGELGAEDWPARKGDELLIFDLVGGPISARRSELYFDAGDLLADDTRVFVMPAVLRRNLQRTVRSRDELVQILTRSLGREVVLLDDAPDHHAGMFMVAAGNRTMLVGDPKLARGAHHPDFPSGTDWSDATQRQFDCIADQVESLGYRVVRIPTIVGRDAKTYLTYVNVITDHRDGRRIVYLPQFRGAESLNEQAAQIWRSLGYEIRSVDCTSTYQLFGNLHCLVNVLRKG